MKKIILSVFALFATVSFAFADGDGPHTVSIIKDGGAAVLYKINTENWWENPLCNGSDVNYSILNDGNGGLTYFNNMDFGTPASLILDGGAMISWGGSYGDNTYTLQYRVYKQGSTAPAWSSFPVNVLIGASGQDKRYQVSGENVDLLALAAENTGVYKLEVQLKVNNDYRNIQTATFSYIGSDLSASFNAVTSGLVNEPITFTNTSLNATSYSWDFGDEETSTVENPVHVYTSAGTYTVTLTVRNDENATDVASSTIKIYDGQNPSTDELLINGLPLTRGIWSVSTLGYSTPAVLTWDYTADKPAGSIGDALRIQTNYISNASSGIAIYQPVILTAGHRYEFNCLFKDLSGAAEGMWLQVFITKEEPSDAHDLAIAQEAVQGSGILTIGELTSWGDNGAGSPKAYNGPFKNQAIKGKLHTGSLCVFVPTESGAYNFIIRTGSWNAPMNIAISDLSLKDLDASITGVQDTEITGIKIYSQTGQIKITAENDINNVYLYHLNGEIVESAVSVKNEFISGKLTPGLYLLNVAGKGYKIVVK